VAAQVERVWESPESSVDVTFDNVTGEISRVDWDVSKGTLHVLIQRPGQPDFQQNLTAPGGTNVPNNRYFLVKDRAGGWSWRQTSYSIGWTP
jgi:hypothetical protein